MCLSFARGHFEQKHRHFIAFWAFVDTGHLFNETKNNNIREKKIESDGIIPTMIIFWLLLSMMRM